METEKVKFAFDPYKSDNPDIREVFKDNLAQIIWCVIKRNHLVDQHFNGNCIGLAKTLRLKKFASITGAELNSLLKNRGMIGSQEDEVGDKLMPYIKEDIILEYVFT